MEEEIAPGAAAGAGEEVAINDELSAGVDRDSAVGNADGRDAFSVENEVEKSGAGEGERRTGGRGEDVGSATFDSEAAPDGAGIAPDKRAAGDEVEGTGGCSTANVEVARDND